MSKSLIAIDTAMSHYAGSCMNDQEYRHKPLDHDQASIRLIQILPTLSDNGSIQCLMENFDLERPKNSGTQCQVSMRKSFRPWYSCLSYTWGNGSKTHLIEIDGKIHSIHRNLWNFLDFARKRIVKDGGIRIPPRIRGDKDRVIEKPWIWIDAICIDQNNIIEKNHQVRQMGKIYESAGWVLMWLGGDCGPPAELIMSTSSYPQYRKDVLRLQEHEYWSRAWITQEVVLAQHPVVCVESGLYDLKEVFKRHGQILDLTRENAFYLLSLHILGLTKLSLRGSTIFQALDIFGTGKHCSKILDRIYSLLALVPSSKIEVDYNISARQLWQRAVTTFQGPLCFCGIFLVAKALEIEPMQSYTGSKPIVQIEVPRYCYIRYYDEIPVIDDKCYRCGAGCILPVDFRHENGSYICLHGICKHLSGHLFVKEKIHGEPSNSRDLEHDEQTESLLTLDNSNLHKITGIVIGPGQMNKNFQTRTWYFRPDALVQIGKIQNGASENGVVQLCNKMMLDIDIGEPLALFKMRVCE